MARTKRDWSDAAKKCLAEPGCRVCGSSRFEMAHISGRAYDATGGYVEPNDIVPLCGPFPTGCHGLYDGKKLDLVPYLSRDEVERCIELLGAGQAAIRLRGNRDPKALPGHSWN